MKKVMVAMMVLVGSLAAAPRVSVGIGFGAPVGVVRPACPGPGYSWVDGYYAPSGGWVNGYWAPPAVERFAPRYGHDRDHDRAFDRRSEHFRR